MNSLSRKDLFTFLTYASVFDIRSLDVNVFLAFYHPKLNFDCFVKRLNLVTPANAGVQKLLK